MPIDYFEVREGSTTDYDAVGRYATLDAAYALAMDMYRSRHGSTELTLRSTETDGLATWSLCYEDADMWIETDWHIAPVTLPATYLPGCAHCDKSAYDHRHGYLGHRYAARNATT
ncbi:hypothetical protein OG896_24900 [Streptomyces sp. NBC_00669]|uniref:hypothetical protein n=1 Tax=Streptomyces sp. NBC_00669 TaxID=2976011 RepID=UPI002E300953|nr:hypothetical protein [Streptomyces sp. NBC_00669]